MTPEWNPAKVEAFKDGFHRFLSQVVINSKEAGAGFRLGDGLYLAQRLVLDDAPFATFGYPDLAMGAKANIDGLLVSPLSDVVMRGVRFA